MKDVIVIGGGPAGLAAAISADKEGAAVLLIEREERLGGILKQCIHDGFGLVRFGEKLSGPEYAERFIDEFLERGIDYRTQAFVTGIKKTEEVFFVSVVDKTGITDYESKTLVLATGCRERTAKQVFIHGTRPSGIFTAGCAQHFVNLLGEMPGRRCVILGSGDIGLIMARRLTLEGAEVIGVYEAKPEPSGLSRNIMQCLTDYGIPLHLSRTVTRVFGDDRLTGVEISEVDGAMKPIAGTGQLVECDTLILSVGLIPENEIAERLGVTLDPRAKGPICDDSLMTDVDGVFSCGNALHVNDLVDYVTESGETAGRSAAKYAGTRRTGGEGRAQNGNRKLPEPCYLPLKADFSLQYLVPQRLRREELNGNGGRVLYFRSREVMERPVLTVKADGRVILKKSYPVVRPPEMERLVIDFGKLEVSGASEITFSLEGGRS